MSLEQKQQFVKEAVSVSAPAARALGFCPGHQAVPTSAPPHCFPRAHSPAMHTSAPPHYFPQIARSPVVIFSKTY